MQVRSLRILLFLLCFTLEVRVKANEVLQEPAGCLIEQPSNCALRAYSDQFHFQAKEFQFSLKKNSIIRTSGPTNWLFVSGVLWLKGLQPENEFSFEIGKLKSVGEVEASFWLIGPKKTSLGGDGWIIRVVKGEVDFVNDENQSLFKVPDGFQVQLQGFDSKGEIIRTNLEPIPFEDHVALWSEFHRGTKAEFLTQVLEFRKKWLDSVELGANIYSSVINRRVAQEKAEAEQQRKRRAQLEADRKEVLELFRRRNYFHLLD